VIEHVVRRTAHFTVEAEHRDAMHRVAEVRRLDHVVLLVASQPVLRSESGGDVEAPDGAQRVERVFEIRGHGSRVREQRDAPALEFPLQFQIRQQTIDAELDHDRTPKGCEQRSVELDDEAVTVMEIGFLRGMFERPV
jgi:hypothetical protein